MAAAEGEERDPPGPAPDPREPRRISGRGGAMTHVPAEELESRALDRAEADYKDAAKVLEAEYARLRPRLDPEMARRWDETLTRARAQLGESRAVAADDVNVRMRVLDGYAGYLRSLRDVVQDSEEAIP